MRLIKRLLRRLLIFGLGIFCVWLIVFVVFETADRRLPWILAVGITYGIAAYIILPRVIRVGLARTVHLLASAENAQLAHGPLRTGRRHVEYL